VGSELAERILTGGPDGAQLEAYEAKHEPLSGSKLGTTGAPKTAAAKAEGPAMAAAAGVLALAQLVAA
jgi:hypothetical protein